MPRCTVQLPKSIALAADEMASRAGVTTAEFLGRVVSDFVVQNSARAIPYQAAEKPQTAIISSSTQLNEDRRVTSSVAHRTPTPSPEGELFRLIFESNMIGIGLWTGDGSIHDANEALLDILGYSKDDLDAGAIRWRAINPPEYADQDQQAIDASIRFGISTPYEKEYIRKDGTRIPVWVGGALLDRDPNRGVFYALDLTSRLLMEDALRKAEEELRTLTDSVPALIGFIGADERIQFANRTYQTWFGRRREEMIGTSLRELLGEVAYEIAGPFFHAALQGTRVEFENRIVRQDHPLREVFVRYEPRIAPSGDVEGVYVLALDITDRKQTMERVRSQSRLLGAVQQAVVAIDTQGMVTYWNSAAETLFGCATDDVIGRPLATVARSHVTARDLRVILHRLAESTDWSGELHIRRTSAAPIDVFVTASPILAQGDVQSGFIGVIVDITERKKAEAAAARRARQQAAVAALGQRTLRNTDLQAILDDGVDTACKALETEFCKVLALQPDGQTALLRAGSGWREGLIGHAMYSIGGASPASAAISGDAPVIVADLNRETSYRDEWLLSEHRVKSGISCVIADTNQRAYGILGAYTKKHRHFTPDDASVLQAIANVMGSALQRDEAQVALRENEAMLQLALAAAQMGTWEIDATTGAIKRSASTDTLLGFASAGGHRSLKEYITRIEPSDLNTVRAAYRRAEKDGAPLLAEFRIQPPGKEAGWVLLRGEIVRDAAGETERVRGSLIDITERKKSEERLRESERRFRIVSELMSDFAYEVRLVAGTFVVEWITEAIERVTGFAASEIMPGSQNLVVYHDDRPAVEEQAAEVMAGNTATAEYRIVARNGDLRWLRHHAHPIVGADGKVERVFGAVQDITERMAALEEFRALTVTLEQRVAERTTELEHTIRELDQFVYIASHDLRAPLRAIDSLAGWVIEDSAALLSDSSREHLDKMQQRVKRMDALLKDLLDYSRAGRHHYLPELINSGDLVRGIAELIEPPVGFVVAIDPHMPTFVAERIPLETVLRNLIGNAYKHHHRPERGIVSVKARIQDSFVEFTVEDNGPGIAAEFHARIFNMFQTLKPRDQVEGSGVGLSIVKKMVESRGGRVTIRSEPGAGSVFTFTWPKVSV